MYFCPPRTVYISSPRVRYFLSLTFSSEDA